ncbi:hypothetical protein [Lederbergia panacisoli]|uniref:hypothetical protein n=1 Tax=Lederbergia panacisoli TaxID=1255251 RepID=UPI00214AED35|nr:hypothetical protein [Lederbergia panacisoli]MCR2823487.1 hypothetical protein [Lederbergia panacisoli]
MEKDRSKGRIDPKVAPGIDAEDSYGEDATQLEIDNGDYTKVTRLIYDEYDPSEK